MTRGLAAGGAGRTQRSGLALAVLALLAEEPMHPYRMQQVLRERGKGDVVNIGQRSQLYKTIDRLVRDGLVVEHGTERDTARPERTVYTLSDDGHDTALHWVHEMLAAPRGDFPEFPIGLSYMMMLSPELARRALETRLADVRSRLGAARAGHEPFTERLPRIVLMDGEFAIALLTAELDWLEALVDDLRSGRLTWSRESLIALAAGGEPPATP